MISAGRRTPGAVANCTVSDWAAANYGRGIASVGRQCNLHCGRNLQSLILIPTDGNTASRVTAGRVTTCRDTPGTITARFGAAGTITASRGTAGTSPACFGAASVVTARSALAVRATCRVAAISSTGFAAMKGGLSSAAMITTGFAAAVITAAAAAVRAAHAAGQRELGDEEG
jgi:hypothetical protein